MASFIREVVYKVNTNASLCPLRIKIESKKY